MNEVNGTGIEYPEIELGGKKYVLKLTRGALVYRISKSGSNLTDIYQPGQKAIAAVIDILHCLIKDEFGGTAEQLAELVWENGTDKIREVGNAVRIAVGKVFPPTQAAPVAAGDQAQNVKPS
jgi:hypothetical protein